MVLEARSQRTVPLVMSCEECLPGWQMADFLVSAHGFSSVFTRRGSELHVSFSYKDSTPIGLGHSLMISYPLKYLFKDLSPNTIIY